MRKVTLLLAAIPCIAVAAETPTADEPIDQVVVVATKTETRIGDVSGDVTIITRADIENTLTTSVADLLRFAPGLDDQGSGTRFGNEGISIRGIGGNRVALEIDGVPITEQFDIGRYSNASRDFIDVSMVERVEILRGPASALYGSSALGGVVAVSTTNPRSILGNDSLGGNAGLLYRDDTGGTQAHGTIALGQPSVSLLVSGTRVDGSERESPVDGAASDLKDAEQSTGLVKLAGNNRFGHTWRVAWLEQSSDVTTDTRSVLGTGRFRSTTRLAAEDRYDMTLASAEYRIKPSDWLFDDVVLCLSHNETNIDQHTVDERAAATNPVSIDRDFAYEQVVRGAELNLWRRFVTGGWEHDVGIGAEWTERETTEMRDGLQTSLVDGSTTKSILGENFPLRDFPVTTTRESGFYVSDQITRGRLSLIAAVRYDDNRLSPDPDATYIEDNPDIATVALRHSAWSPKLAAIFRLTENADVYLQYAHGFRAPPFEDANLGFDIALFNYRAIPNPDLESETSDGVELGLRWNADRQQFSAALFHTDYDDFIESKARLGTDAASGRTLFQSRNIGAASISGVEASWHYALSEAPYVTIDASAYIARGDNDDTGEPLNTVGPAQAVIGATWTSVDGRTQASLKSTLTDDWDRLDETSGDLFSPPGHAVFDFYVSRSIGNSLVLRGAVRNLADRTYWRWSEVRGMSPDDPVLPLVAAPGRNYSISLTWSW